MIQRGVRTLEDTIETFLFEVQSIYDSVSQISKTSEAPCVRQEPDFLLFPFRQMKEYQINQRHYILMWFLLNLLG